MGAGNGSYPVTWDELIPSNEFLNGVHLVYVIIGVFIILFGLYSLIIKNKLHMSESLVIL
jgi:hypothetical protein